MTASIRRMPGNLGAYIVVNNANEHVRFRYLHMNPKFMDADGLLNGRQVSEGEIIGKVATWGDYRERHLLPPAFQHPGVHQYRLGLGQSLHDAGRGL